MQSIIRWECACRTMRLRAPSRTRASGSQHGVDAAESPLRRLVRDAGAFGETAPSEGELQWATQPYAASMNLAGTEHAPPRPEESSVLLFPGADSHFVGMGRRLQELPAARDLYELASSIVGWDVGRVCREGPAEALAQRSDAAVLVTSLAALESARERRPAALQRVRAVAGFAMGELAALVFAAVLPFERALRLAELHTAAVQAAGAERAGGMLTVRLGAEAQLGTLMARACERAAERGVRAPLCRVAVYLSPGSKVLAGDEEALRFVEVEGRAWGVRSGARVRGAPALHTPLMARAEAAMHEALRACEARAPRVRVVSCLDARAYGGGGEVRTRLARLVTAPVRWEQTLHSLFARPRGDPQPLTLALGPAAALRSTLRLVNARAWDASVPIDV